MAEKMSIQCPVCQHPSSQPLEMAINTRTTPELKQKLLDGTLLMFECENCGAKRRITTQVLYHDPDKKLLFFVAPNYNRDKESIQEQLTELLQSFPVSLENYEMRIMIDPADLMEKVHIFDAGHHDTEIELVKMLTDGLFVQENPGKNIKNRYFYINPQGKSKFLYITDDEQLMVDCHEKLLEFIHDKFKKALTQEQKGSFKVINHAWANNILQKKKMMKVNLTNYLS